jgi:hypothetical protein
MFKFLKSLFGGDPEINKQAAIHIEQVPYKVEPPVVEDKVAIANTCPIEKAEPVEGKPAAITATKKPAAKKPAVKKPAAKKPAAKKKPAKKNTP